MIHAVTPVGRRETDHRGVVVEVVVDVEVVGGESDAVTGSILGESVNLSDTAEMTKREFCVVFFVSTFFGQVENKHSNNSLHLCFVFQQPKT